MKIGIQTLTKARGAWHSFRSNHPDVLPFLKDTMNKGLREDVRFDIRVRFPDGEEKNCEICVKQGDKAFFDILGDVLQ
ncbi:MAG: hypothetical protein K6C08_06695 [Oscillospiraceae bacterium]|nr:hypothetical protein [Oscillospiraceae bacterium]